MKLPKNKWVYFVAVAILVALSIAPIMKKISQNRLEKQKKREFLAITDPDFIPLDLKLIKSKTIEYDYKPRTAELYHKIQQNKEYFATTMLAESCKQNKKQIQTGIKIQLNYYFDQEHPQNNTNDPQSLFLTIPITNETCRLIT